MGRDRKIFNYTKDTKDAMQLALKNFQKLANKAKLEHEKLKPDGLITPTYQDSIIGEGENNFPVIAIEHEHVNVRGLSEKENRELDGVINPISTTEGRTGDNGALQIQVDYFDKALNETQLQLSNNDNHIEQELQDRINGLTTARDLTIEQRQLEEVREQQEEDISRLQQLKEWLKENWLGASALGITIASFITTIIVAARSAIVKGGQTLGKLGQAIANLAKKAGPLLASLLNIVATALKWGAAGIAWLASNLWVLVLVWFIYDQYGNSLRSQQNKK